MQSGQLLNRIEAVVDMQIGDLSKEVVVKNEEQDLVNDVLRTRLEAIDTTFGRILGNVPPR
eukprot:7738668-Karenia_brevis.AAC.1